MRIKYSKTDIGGDIVKDNETYQLKDNKTLKNLVLSSTRLYRGQQTRGHRHEGQEEVYFFVGGHGEMIVGDEDSGIPAAKSFAAAAWSVAIADVSMSLDNVLAVAGAAREHPGILIVGLIFAVALMGIAANIIARYIERYRWIGWVGLAVIVYVAVKMIWEGFHEVQPHLMAFAGL